MNKVVFLVLLVMGLSSCAGADSDKPHNETGFPVVQQDAFAGLKWKSEYCNHMVGLYRHWNPAPVYNNRDNEMLRFNGLTLGKGTNEIFFRDQEFKKNVMKEKDFGDFSYKLYKRVGNKVAIEVEDRLLEVIKNKIPRYYQYFGRYFVFEPVYENLESNKDDFEYDNCGLAIASCKTPDQVEMLFADDLWYIGNCYDGDCEREIYKASMPEE